MSLLLSQPQELLLNKLFFKKNRKHMSLKAKYQPVIELLKIMNVDDLKILEENGALTIYGDVKTVQEKELFLDRIHKAKSENAMDINFQLGVKNLK